MTGKLVQTGIGLASDDGGGQLDPHGADGLGNPIGGLVFTNAFASSNGDTNSFIQAVEWNKLVIHSSRLTNAHVLLLYFNIMFSHPPVKSEAGSFV